MWKLELHNVVITEGIAFLLIALVIFATFKRWKLILYISCVAASTALLSAWSILMALGSMMIYLPASALLWIELGDEDNSVRFTLIRVLCWFSLAIGVTMIILKNIFNIYGYLS